MGFNPNNFIKRLINKDDSTYELMFPNDHLVFESHFPGNPIVPGILQFSCALASFKDQLTNNWILIEIQQTKQKIQVPSETPHTITIQKKQLSENLIQAILSITNQDSQLCAKYKTLWSLKPDFESKTGSLVKSPIVRMHGGFDKKLIQTYIPLRPPMQMVTHVWGKDILKVKGYLDVNEIGDLLHESGWPSYYCMESIGQLIACGFADKEAKSNRFIIEGYLGGGKKS